MMKYLKQAAALSLCGLLLVGCANAAAPQNAQSAPAEASAITPCTLGTEEGCYIPVGLFSDRSTTLTYVDYASAQQVFLCTRPNCTHHEDGCTAWFSADDPVSQFSLVNGKLLLTLAQTQKDLSPHIDTLDPDGTNRKRLVSFPDNMSIDIRFYADDDTLYFLANVLTQETPQSEPILDRSLYALALDTGEYQLLYTFPDHNPTAFLCGASGRTLFVATIDRTSGMLNTQPFAVDTAQWGDPLSGTTEGATGYVQDGAFLERDTHSKTLTLSRLDEEQSFTYHYAELEAQQPQPLLNEPGFSYLYDHYCRMQFISVVDDTSQFNDYVIDMENGEVFPFLMQQSYDGGTMAILAQHDDQLLVWRDTVEVAMQGQDGLDDCYYLLQYALISKEDYAHSVQNFTEIASPLADYVA